MLSPFPNLTAVASRPAARLALITRSTKLETGRVCPVGSFT